MDFDLVLLDEPDRLQAVPKEPPTAIGVIANQNVFAHLKTGVGTQLDKSASDGSTYGFQRFGMLHTGKA
jgi:hypothetical protein